MVPDGEAELKWVGFDGRDRVRLCSAARAPFRTIRRLEDDSPLVGACQGLVEGPSHTTGAY